MCGVNSGELGARAIGAMTSTDASIGGVNAGKSADTISCWVRWQARIDGTLP